MHRVLHVVNRMQLHMEAFPWQQVNSGMYLKRSRMPSLNSSFPMAAVRLGLIGGRDGKYMMTMIRIRAQTPASVSNIIIHHHLRQINPRITHSYWYLAIFYTLSRWLCGTAVEVTVCRAQLVLGWVTVSGFNSSCRKFNQPPRSTQPSHPTVGKRNEYRSKDGDALRLGSKGRYGVVCR